MATLVHFGSILIYSNALGKNLRLPLSFTCSTMAKTTMNDGLPIVPRRSANYKPSFWDHRDLLSIENKHVKYKGVQERDSLKEKVRKMLVNEKKKKKSYLDQLELIEDLEKLGVSYHFQREIENILTGLYKRDKMNNIVLDLHATALEFRLFRQHGFNVSEDVFDVFMENFEKLENDVNGLISLYEASYLSTKSDTKLQNLIRPLIRPWLGARWYIDVYGKRLNKNIDVMDFAKIDFNIVQAIHQEEVRYVSSWWRETGLGNQLHFARDRIVENYFWTIGQIQEPQFGYVRRTMTKINALITTIDDIYDIYGTLEELQLFTLAFEKWDVNHLDELPEYMRLCFLVLYNEVNSIACVILRNQNINVIPYLKRSWADLCRAYLVEAKWYRSGHKPNMEEYMQNAWVSVSAPTIFVHFYCVFSDHISIQVLEAFSKHKQNIVRCSASVLRLANDLATSPDELARGDVIKSIQCYINETGASEEKARSHVLQMIDDMWDEMNHEKMKTHSSSSSLLHNDFVETVMNLARMSQCMYQYGDGHGSPEKAKIIDRVISILFDPIPLY